MSRNPDIISELDAMVDDFDHLVADAKRGIRSQSHYDDLEYKASLLAARLRSTFRGRGCKS